MNIKQINEIAINKTLNLISSDNFEQEIDIYGYLAISEIRFSSQTLLHLRSLTHFNALY